MKSRLPCIAAALVLVGDQVPLTVAAPVVREQIVAREDRDLPSAHSHVEDYSPTGPTMKAQSSGINGVATTTVTMQTVDMSIPMEELGMFEPPRVVSASFVHTGASTRKL